MEDKTALVKGFKVRLPQKATRTGHRKTHKHPPFSRALKFSFYRIQKSNINFCGTVPAYCPWEQDPHPGTRAFSSLNILNRVSPCKTEPGTGAPGFMDVGPSPLPGTNAPSYHHLIKPPESLYKWSNPHTKKSRACRRPCPCPRIRCFHPPVTPCFFLFLTDILDKTDKMRYSRRLHILSLSWRFTLIKS